MFSALEMFAGCDTGDMCEITAICLRDASFLSIQDKYRDHLKTALEATEDAEIQRLGLSVLKKAENELDVQVIVQTGYFDQLLRLLASEGTLIGVEAVELISHLFALSSAEDRQAIKRKLGLLLEGRNRQGSGRLASLMSRLAIGEGGAELLACLKKDLGSNDALLLVNALQTIREGCTTRDAYRALEGLFPEVIRLVSLGEHSVFAAGVLAEVALIQDVDASSWMHDGGQLLGSIKRMLCAESSREQEAALFLTGCLLANASAAPFISSDLTSALAECSMSRANDTAFAAMHGAAMAFRSTQYHRLLSTVAFRVSQEHACALHELYDKLQHETGGQLLQTLSSKCRNPIDDAKNAAYFLLGRLLLHEYILRVRLRCIDAIYRMPGRTCCCSFSTALSMRALPA